MVRLLIKFSESIMGEPITSKVILDLRVPITIVTAHIDSKGGEILADVPEADLEKVVKAFRKRGATVNIPKLVEVDIEKCVSCGSWVALCPVEAVTLAEDCSVVFNQEKCLGSTCSTCVDACPARAIKSIKQVNQEPADSY
jgi:MinD superfamily P-loop ATPase